METSDLIFRPTLNLGKRIKAVPRESFLLANHPLLDWSAMEFEFGGRQYITLINTPSLYCTVIPITDTDFAATWNIRLYEGIKNSLNSVGRYSDFVEFTISEHRNIRIAKSLNRSVSSSLSMYTTHARDYMRMGVEPAQLAHRLNETPMSGIAKDGENYGIPRECFETMLDRFKH
jgi:hypothetical protein